LSNSDAVFRAAAEAQILRENLNSYPHQNLSTPKASVSPIPKRTRRSRTTQPGFSPSTYSTRRRFVRNPRKWSTVSYRAGDCQGKGRFPHTGIASQQSQRTFSDKTIDEHEVRISSDQILGSKNMAPHSLTDRPIRERPDPAP